MLGRPVGIDELRNHAGRFWSVLDLVSEEVHHTVSDFGVGVEKKNQLLGTPVNAGVGGVGEGPVFGQRQHFDPGEGGGQAFSAPITGSRIHEDHPGKTRAALPDQ